MYTEYISSHLIFVAGYILFVICGKSKRRCIFSLDEAMFIKISLINSISFQKTEDGEYLILLGGKNVSIFCHKMSTSMPKEYLSLPSGEKENYSEVYGWRLITPNSCPNNGTRFR